MAEKKSVMEAAASPDDTIEPGNMKQIPEQAKRGNLAGCAIALTRKARLVREAHAPIVGKHVAGPPMVTELDKNPFVPLSIQKVMTATPHSPARSGESRRHCYRKGCQAMDDQSLDAATTDASTLTDEQHDWTSNFCGIDTRADGQDQAASNGLAGASPTIAVSAPANGSGAVDTSSDDYKQGYQDGVGGRDRAGAPRAGASMDNYDAGFAEGQKEHQAQTPADAGAPPADGGASRSVDPNAAPNQPVDPNAGQPPPSAGPDTGQPADAAPAPATQSSPDERKAGAADALGAVVNAAVDSVNDAIHFFGGTGDVDTALGAAAQFADKTLTPILDPAKFAPRPLNGDERNYAHAIFFDTLNYDPITITGGGVATIGEHLTETECRTIGNSIGLSPDMFKADGTLTNEGMQTLIHEMTHVWQYQHNGWSYMRKALVAQGAAQLMQGDNGEAYDWERLAKAGTPWEQWNPEAQAKAVEEYNIALRAANGGSTDSSVYQKLGELQPYLDKMTAGTERGDYPNPDTDQKTG